MKYEIKTIEVRFLGLIKYFEIDLPKYKIGETPDNLIITLYNDLYAPVYTFTIAFSDNVYENWGTDDSILVKWVAEAISVTLA